MKWLRRAALALLILVLLAAAVLWFYGRQALPQVDGTLAVAASELQSPVRIERDADGIPTIHAQSVRDAMFGLGFVHAQDRLWQMETHRRIGAGRLAEAFGEKSVPTDRFIRALGVRRAAAAQWQRLQGESREVLMAYAAGVNAYLRGHVRALPPEFMLLGVRPEDWDPVDSLAWLTMMAWDLGGNWGTELLRMRLALKMPVERINELLPPYPGEAPLVTADYAAAFRGLGLDAPLAGLGIERMLAAAPPSGQEGEGSNNWVVAGPLTESGKPLLANDPHLKLSAPALWYFVRIDAPGFKVAGATMPGVPLVALGQNEHVAWGFTNTNPDVQDLYLERVKPGDAAQYQTPDGWAKFGAAEEVIKVRGGADVKVTVRTTRHGPVISDAGVADDLVDPGRQGRPGYAIAMRWTALDADIDTVAMGLAINRARSVQDFFAAARDWAAPMQNMAVADRDGRIGLIAPGRVPVRRADNELKGQVPSPGWDARYDWAGWVPAGELPRQADPARGFIATANQRIVEPGYPHYITSEWVSPLRHGRIEELLRAKPKHSVDNLAAIQADERSPVVPLLLPWLQKARSNHPLADAALRAAQSFDGTMAADQAAPLIFWAWMRELTRGVFADEMGAGLYEQALGTRTFREALTDVLQRRDAWWCDDKATAGAAETCEQQNDAAFTRALDELQKRHGGDVSAWRWGDAHQARSEHRPFSRVKALARLFELRAPVGGDTFTVNVQRVLYKPDATTGELFLSEHGPSLRAIYDLGDPSQSRFMHSTGQSGIPWSPQYRSFVRRWAKVEYVPVWDDPARTAHSLTIQPGG